jgi:AraC-like DNA-binding protein
MNTSIYSDKYQNAVRLSAFDHFNGMTKFNQVAAKFVLTGKETYILEGRKYLVESGEYIIGNNQTLSEVNISEHTKGICIDISNSLIEEIVTCYFEQSDLLEFMLTDKFLVNKYNSSRTSLGLKLNTLSNKLSNQNPKTLFINTELFYSIGESIVIDQAQIFSEYTKLTFKKQIVNKDHYRNLLKTKNYIDDCFLQTIHINELAELAFMSKFAFIRLFKQIFGLSPYQYLLKKRLYYSKQLLTKSFPINEIATTLHFADTPSFSKAFKATFGTAPTAFYKKATFDK